MKFSKIQFVNPKGLEIVVRGVSTSVYQLESVTGWDLADSEYGVVARHETRGALFLPWGLIGPCDVLEQPDEARRGPGRPPKAVAVG